jgi:hypothetical protein
MDLIITAAQYIQNKHHASFEVCIATKGAFCDGY